MKFTTADIVQTLAIAISVLGLWYQLRRGWLLHSAEMVTDLLVQFNSPEFERRRRSFAKLLKERGVAGELVPIAKGYPLGVLGFYEHIGHLVHRRALDEKMVWTKFAWELVCYFHCITKDGNALEAARQKNGDRTLYEEMEWLNGRFVKIYLSRGVALYKEGRVRWLEEFFSQETSLGSHESGSPV